MGPRATAEVGQAASHLLNGNQDEWDDPFADAFADALGCRIRSIEKRLEQLRSVIAQWDVVEHTRELD